MNFDCSKLSEKITEKFGTQYNFAVGTGLLGRIISLKQNNTASTSRFKYSRQQNLSKVLLQISQRSPI